MDKPTLPAYGVFLLALGGLVVVVFVVIGMVNLVLRPQFEQPKCPPLNREIIAESAKEGMNPPQAYHYPESFQGRK